MKYAVHILLIQLFICNRCKVRIIMWFNCFNSSHQLNNHIFLSRPSRTSVCDDTNLSLYNFPSLFLSSSTVDVIHSLPTFLTLFVFLSCVSSLLFTDYSNPPSSMSPCTVSVSAPSIQLRTSLRARTDTRPGQRAYAYQVWSWVPRPGHIRVCTLHSAGTITRYHPYPSVITCVSVSSNTQKPENNF